MLKKIKNIILISLLISATLLSAATTEEQYAAANVKAKSKDYKAAITLYEAILEKGEASADLYYNLGFSHYEAGHIGQSILNFERALALNPSHTDARFNLKFAQKSIKGKLNPAPEFFLVRMWRNTRDTLSSGTWGLLAILAAWAALAMGALFLLGGTKKRKQVGFFGGISLLIFSLLLCFVASSKRSIEQHSQRAVVMASFISLKNIPEDSAQDMDTLPEGSTLVLLQQVGDWTEVKLIDGRKAWTKAEGLEEI